MNTKNLTITKKCAHKQQLNCMVVANNSHNFAIVLIMDYLVLQGWN